MWGGALLLALSLFMLLGFERSDASFSSPAALMAVLITVVLPGAAGIALMARHLYSGRRLEQRRDLLRQQTLESEVLRLASQHSGRLALVDIIQEIAVSSDAAQRALDSLVSREIADIAVTDSGTLIYTFRDIERAGEKFRARNVLE
jgi:hypothetical protein